jgi:hypothetical protein
MMRRRLYGGSGSYISRRGVQKAQEIDIKDIFV